ncbi:MAG: hypothetical protein KBB88_02730 [Candidatus Pacebacteria bacterium]|nr:hypothetical protein [Candidatus Paceibacterota bacterium]
MRTRTLEINQILIGVLVAIVVVYGLFEARVLLGLFTIEVTSAYDGQTFTEPLIPITGTVKHAETIYLNGMSIPINRDDSFAEHYLLSPGYNEISIRAENTFGRSETVHLRLYLKKEE